MSVLAVCSACQTEYDCDAVDGGTEFDCEQCGAVVQIPVAEGGGTRSRARGADGPFDFDRFLFMKKSTLSGHLMVHDEEDHPILFVERPTHFRRRIVIVIAGVVVGITGFMAFIMTVAWLEVFAPRLLNGYMVILALGLIVVSMGAVIYSLIPMRRFAIYTDETRSQLLLEIFQDRKLSFVLAWYSIKDARQETIGRLEKNWVRSLAGKRWIATSFDGRPAILAWENVSLERTGKRLIGPGVASQPADFTLERQGTRKAIGKFSHSELDLMPDQDRVLDRRIAVALGIYLFVNDPF